MFCVKVQSLVANGKELDLGQALRIAADVQPLPVSEDVIQEVRSCFISLFFPSFDFVSLLLSALSKRSLCTRLVMHIISDRDVASGNWVQVLVFITRRLEQLLVCPTISC
jgi:hypothetical protein